MKSVLSQRLRSARAAIHPEITQRQIAKECDVSPSAVNLWEAGKTEPSATNLLALAKRYRVTTDWLLGSDAVYKESKNSATTESAYHVPLVSSTDIGMWQLNDSTHLIQTCGHYPNKTAAAMLVANDALASVCPAGSIVVISQGRVASPGQIVLAIIGSSSEPVLRKYVSEAGVDLLVADDMRFPSFNMADGVKIIGCVTEVIIRKLLA
jgi:SOS-response transcriptional repressor LexA